jgi:hypothetical protein
MVATRFLTSIDPAFILQEQVNQQDWTKKRACPSSQVNGVGTFINRGAGVKTSLTVDGDSSYSAPVCDSKGVVLAWLLLKKSATEKHSSMEYHFLDHISSLGCWTLQTEIVECESHNIAWLSDKSAYGAMSANKQVRDCKYGIREVASDSQVELYMNAGRWKFDDFRTFICKQQKHWRTLEIKSVTPPEDGTERQPKKPRTSTGTGSVDDLDTRTTRSGELCVRQTVTSQECCDKKCCQFHNVQAISKVRQLCEESKRDKSFVFRGIESVRPCDNATARYVYKFPCDSDGAVKEVCKTAYLLMYDIPRSTFDRCFKAYRESGAMAVAAGNPIPVKEPNGVDVVNNKRGEKASSKVFHGWMQRAIEMGDKMPDDERVLCEECIDDDGTVLSPALTTPTIQFPNCYTKSDVYTDYCAYVRNLHEHQEGPSDDSCISKAQFYKLWDRDYSHVTLSSTLNFEKCDMCTKITQLQKGLRLGADKAKMQKLTRMKQSHNEFQKRQRHVYYRKAAEAVDNPREVMSVIIDGMDQSKTDLPHWRQMSKGTAKLTRFGFNLTGAIVHGFGAQHFWSFDDVSHNASNTCTVLHKVIELYREKRGYIPRKLYLQLDNGENKGHTLFAYCALLVEQGTFEEIEVSFLPPGTFICYICIMFVLEGFSWGEQSRGGSSELLPPWRVLGGRQCIDFYLNRSHP